MLLLMGLTALTSSCDKITDIGGDGLNVKTIVVPSYGFSDQFGSFFICGDGCVPAGGVELQSKIPQLTWQSASRATVVNAIFVAEPRIGGGGAYIENPRDIIWAHIGPEGGAGASLVLSEGRYFDGTRIVQDSIIDSLPPRAAAAPYYWMSWSIGADGFTITEASNAIPFEVE